MQKLILALVPLVLLSACNPKPYNPNNATFVFDFHDSSNCHARSINGHSPNGADIAFAEPSGEYEVVVHCSYSVNLLSHPEVNFSVPIDAAPSGIYYFKTSQTQQGLQGWFETKDGAKATQVVSSNETAMKVYFVPAVKVKK